MYIKKSKAPVHTNMKKIHRRTHLNARTGSLVNLKSDAKEAKSNRPGSGEECCASWTEMISKGMSLISKIRKGVTSLIGQGIRRKNTEHLEATGMVDGKHSIGKLRKKRTEGIEKSPHCGNEAEIQKTSDKEVWRNVSTIATK